MQCLVPKESYLQRQHDQDKYQIGVSTLEGLILPNKRLQQPTHMEQTR